MSKGSSTPKNGAFRLPYLLPPRLLATRLATQGATPRFLNAAQLTAFEAAEAAKWQEAVKFSGAKLD